MEHKSKKGRRIRHALNAPLIYSFIVPAVITDIALELYHQIGFRLCDIELVNRSDYIRIDRHKLHYLTNTERINCMYCGYVNGLFNYGTEIAARSEQYWCGIQHEVGKNFNTPNHHKGFLKFGDEKSFKEKFN